MKEEIIVVESRLKDKMSRKSSVPSAVSRRPLLSLVLLLLLIAAMLALTACAGHAASSQHQVVPASSQSQSTPVSNQNSTPPTGEGSPAQQVQSIDQQVQGTLPALDQAQNDANNSDQGQDNAPLP